jgi:GAF domain-containing protein
MSYVKIVRNVKLPENVAFDPTAVPPNDVERIKALRRFQIMDTPSEEIFSLYCELAALTFHTPIALISFVDEDKVFYKESFGVNRTGQIVNRKNSPCTLAIMNNEITLLRYALTDPCVLADVKNLEEAGYKFYAGAPMRTSDQFNIGMLAVVDKNPKSYSDEELNKLKELAAELMKEVELRLDADKATNIKSLNERIHALRARIDALKS